MSDGLLVLLILFSVVDEDLVGNIHRQFVLLPSDYTWY